MASAPIAPPLPSVELPVPLPIDVPPVEVPPVEVPPVEVPPVHAPAIPALLG